LAATGWGIYSFLAPARPAPVRPVPFQNFLVSPVTNSGDATDAAISPDGKYILMVKTDAGRESLWLRNVVSASDTQIVAPAATRYADLTFSPDGNYIYFKRMVATSGFDLFRAPVLGGMPQDVGRDVDSNITFSPDGKTMAYLRANDPDVGKFRVLTAAVDGSNETVQYNGPLSESTTAAVSWLPKGNLLAWSQSIGLGGIGLFDLATKKVRPLGAPYAMVTQIVWAPDGSGLFIVYQTTQTGGRKQIGFVSYPSRKFTPLTRDTNNYPSFSLSGDGKTIAAVQQVADFHLALLSSAGVEIPPPAALLAATQNIYSFDWDGDSLLLNKGSDIVRISRGGQSSTTLMHDPGAATMYVAGCPAAHSFVLTLFTAHSPNGTIWRIGANGTNPVQLTHGQLDYSPVCSPDGKWVYYGDAAHSRLMRVPLAGNGSSEVVPGSAVPDAILGSYTFGLSPDGKRLAYLVSVVDPATKAVSTKIAVLDIGSGKPARLLKPDPRIGSGPVFISNGKMLTYQIREKGVDNIWIQPLNGSRGHQPTHFTSEQIREFRWSPDGKNLAVLRGHTNSDVVLLRASQP
jgi:Tol biopolymer transport system component